MQQLLLDIRPAARPTLDNFIPGPNRELLGHLNNWLASETAETALYIWGPPGSGKTHLLNALAAEAGGQLWNGAGEIAAELPLIAVDDVESLAESAQIAVFDAYNRARAAGRRFVAAGENAPAGLSLREDLRTRLGWGLVYRLYPLSDADMQAALARHAQALGFELDPAIANWLLTRASRNLGYLLQIVEALDRYSLQTRRRITLPLLKEILP
ncbi:DnaA regulatory inactivator Hda [Betaproteobacteria bacterium SCN2]|nr:DnaA regulatory inactivator Hda [Betaproteobacteria bacterium SCN2]